MFTFHIFGYTYNRLLYSKIERVRALGYILPIRPIQSEQYANRLNMGKYNFALVEGASPVNLKSDFLDEYEEKIYSIESQKEESELEQRQQSNEDNSDAPLDVYQGYIAPNPANLSPAISNVVGKGLAINAYV